MLPNLGNEMSARKKSFILARNCKYSPLLESQNIYDRKMIVKRKDETEKVIFE